jgi:3-oxoadipate enol-lactonase
VIYGTAVMPTAQLPDATLHYEIAGAGPRLLILSGTGSDTRRPPGPFAWPGADRFEAVAYDHRGLGQSIDHADAVPTMAVFAADALALADHLGWERFGVLGISFGGMVAQELALAAGDRVSRLVLAVTSPGGNGGSSYPLHDVYTLDAEARHERMIELLDTRTADDPKVRDSVARFLAAAPDGAPPPGLLRQLEARSHHDTWERLGSLRVPTLVMAGRFDGIAPLQTVSGLAAAIPGARLEVRDGGHVFLRDDPPAWAQITEFLAEG